MSLQSLRLVIPVLALYVISAISLSGQETAPADRARAGGGFDEPAPSPVVPPNDPMMGEKRTEGLDLGLVLSAAYEDNIFLSAKDPQSDYVGRVTPKIAYTKGDKETQEGGFLKFAYSPSLVIYSENRDDDRVDHQAELSVGARGKKAAFEYSVAYSKLGDATADTGRQTDRDVLDHIVRVAWIPREKLALEVAAGQSISDYADKVLLDSRDAFGEIAMRYAYSPKTRVGLIYRAGRFEVDGAKDQKYQRLTGAIEWQPREKVRVELAAGVEKREVENGTNLTPVLEGRISWKPAEKTDLYLTAYRRETASAFSAGQNYRLTGATAGIAQQIGNKWTARLEAGAERADYRLVEGNTSGDVGRDDVWFVRPSLEYRLTEELGLEVFYRISSNTSTREGFGYDQQSAGVSLQYKF